QVGLGARLPGKINGMAFRVGHGLQAAGSRRREQVARIDGHGHAGRAGNLNGLALQRYFLNALESVRIGVVERRVVVENSPLVGAGKFEGLLGGNSLLRSKEWILRSFRRGGRLCEHAMDADGLRRSRRGPTQDDSIGFGVSPQAGDLRRGGAGRGNSGIGGAGAAARSVLEFYQVDQWAKWAGAEGSRELIDVRGLG